MTQATPTRARKKIRRRHTEAERFWMKVDGGDVDTCWLWTAALQDNGYGMFRVDEETRMGAHRWAYISMRAEIPAGLSIDHLCRNRACVNPWHLEPVTTRVNAFRSDIAPAAVNAAKTHCPQGHAYSPENTSVVRGRRVCIACRRAKQAKRNAAAAAAR